MTNSPQAFNEYNYVCYSTEEYIEFIEVVKQQGGEVTDSFALTNGQGLSVEYRLPAKTK